MLIKKKKKKKKKNGRIQDSEEIQKYINPPKVLKVNDKVTHENRVLK